MKRVGAIGNASPLTSCVYRGQIHHRRFTPREHKFAYTLDYFYLNLDEIDRIFNVASLGSSQSSKLVSFQRQDYLPSKLDLKQEVIEHIRLSTDKNFVGQIFLLATLRSLGYCMNPIALFYCFDHHERLCHIVAEVHNTPWDERHVYVLGGDFKAGSLEQTQKAFHVSPFMPMDTTYNWDVGVPHEYLQVNIKVVHADAPLFEASMRLSKIEMTAENINGLVFNQARQAFRMILGIYYQAMKLWLKKMPLYPHPGK